MAETTITTTAGTHAAQYGEDAVVAAATTRGEPDWLRDQRAEAARAFGALPMPTPQLRPWKYTDVTALAIDGYAPVTDAGWMRVQGGTPARGFAGTIADAIADADHGERVRTHLGSMVRATEGKFIAANAALWRTGAFVYVPRGQAFATPVTVTLEAPAEAGRALFPRVLIVAEPASEVTVVLRNHSGDADLLVSAVVEIIAGDDTNVRLVLDGRWGDATREFTTVRSRLGRAAHVQTASLAIGGALVKQTVEGLLEGEGSTSSIRGAALGGREQHFDFVTLQDHIGPKTESDVEIKAALAGASKSIYYGITRVEETAAGAAANQVNRNLLLSGHAKADSDPVLEILTSDVIRCGHGATVGPVDEEALFYLQSRGLDRREALQLLVAGFFRSVLKDVNVPGLEDELEAAVMAKLATAEL
ncbi:MAG: Fe-S cluster assembly protein SufD [Chloroflexi bacterium]|nr:Fe-S cluster assembly protein SufD [Chloroflexota bacterium]MDA1001879.1 Fe-S cluster assembly protein SufD [Chloroflexota bacterium]